MTKPYRGSRKHVLDWSERPTFLSEFLSLVGLPEVKSSEPSIWMPRGYAGPDEARLESFAPKALPNEPIADALQDWWLVHKRGATTPNWDIALACEIEGKPGLVLVEAKANVPELKEDGKRHEDDDSANSKENHARIGQAIVEACEGLRRIHSGINISRDSHYQLANRVAFTWKLATLGVPTVLVYLGFTGDDGIRDAGEPFATDAGWREVLLSHAKGSIPTECFDKRLEVEGTPIWLLVRSRPVLEQSPPARPRV